jgi:hypothetical protein
MGHTDAAKENRPVVNPLNAALRPYLQLGGALPRHPLVKKS